MKLRKSVFIAALSVAALTSCGGGQPTTYKLTFHQDEGNKDDIFTVTKGKTTAEEAKEFQNKITINPRKGYDTAWEEYDFSKITSDHTVNMTYTAHEYTITYKHDDKILGTTKYTVNNTDEEIKAKEPKLPTPEETGLDYKYEDYTIKDKCADFTVNAISQGEHEFTITYLDGDNILGTTKYTTKSTDEEVKDKEPTIPDAKGYTRKYEEYTIVNKKEDFSVNVEDTAITYHAKFVDEGGTQVGELVPFTVETESIKEPDVPTKEHYDGVWEEYASKFKEAKDITVKPVYTAHEYTAKFINGETTTTKKFTILNSKITTPDVTAVEHYTHKWSDGTNSYDPNKEVDMKSNLKDTTFNLVTTGEKHTITINVNGGTLPANAATTIQVEYGKAYTLPTPTFKSGVATFMGWFDSSTGKQVATTGTSTFTDDATVIARYMGDLETEAGKDVVISGTRGGTIKTWELTDEDKTQGSKCLKLTSKGSDESGQSTTVGCSFDSDFLTSAFADTNVNAVNFDLKASAALTKLSYGNSTTAPYEHNCCTSDKPGFGGQTFWKTFSLTREMYTSASDKALLICTVGGQLPNGGNIWIDNIRPSSTTVNLFGFEGSRMVPKDDSSSHYKKSVSFRDFSDAEIFTITTGYADAINFGFDYQYKTEGLRSIHYEHKQNTNVWLTLPQIDLTKIKEVSFDICLSKAFNGNTVRDGNGNELFSSSKVYQAYEWVTFTVPVKQIGNANQFCTVTSSVECDFWVDNIKIVLNA